MPKKKFLVPIAAIIAGMSANLYATETSLESKTEIVRKNEGIQLDTETLDDKSFILNKSDDEKNPAAHQSHYSHRSHSSHRSHYSSSY